MSDEWCCIPYARPFAIHRTLSIHNQSLTASSSSLIFGPFRGKCTQTLRYFHGFFPSRVTVFTKIAMQSLILAWLLKRLDVGMSLQGLLASSVACFIEYIYILLCHSYFFCPFVVLFSA